MEIWRKVLIILFFASTLLSQVRKIKPGDTIDITVYGHQELSRVVSVSPQGIIDFPFLQSWPVDGLTLDELREIIAAKLSSYLNVNPLITVGFVRNSSVNINVLGMVLRPGIVQMPIYSTLQGAISTAGGFAPGAHMDQVLINRLENGKMVSQSYNLEKFMRTNDLAENPQVQEGDLILVSGTPLLTNVKVVGAVRTPGQVYTPASATIMEAIMQAGGPLDDADMSKIIYISAGNKQNLEMKLDLRQSLQDRRTTNLPIAKPDDIIYIPKKKNIWRTVMSISRDLTTFALAAYYISRTVNQ
jgi:polysaccharide export outer membrane protein